MDYWVIVIWATCGSLLGGSIAYFLGRTLSNTNWLASFMEKRGKEVVELREKFGDGALVIGAISPVPYSIVCWASGMVKMPFSHFFMISQLRWLRVVAYLLLIRFGIINLFS